MNLIIIIAITYLTVVSIVLKAFHFLRDKNMMEPTEVLHTEHTYRQSA